jgi:hypothetical protein
MHLILDTGPWVALLCRNDRHHEWAKAQFAQHRGALLTCEANLLLVGPSWARSQQSLGADRTRRDPSGDGAE